MKRNLLFNQVTAIGKRFAMVLTMLLMLGVTQVWGETYTMTIDQNGNKGNNNVHITNTSKNSSQDVSYNDITWSVAWEGNGAPMQGGTTECQFGSSKNPCSMVTLSTSDIVGTITSIKINARGASGNDAVVAVNVGGSSFINGSNNSVSIGTTDGDKELSGEAIGTIVITISQTTSKAIYIKSISVTYEENSGGGEPTPEPDDDTEDACGWIETDISNISSTDDVVITMTNGTTTWALTNGNGTSKAPAATILTMNTDGSISENPNQISDAILWNISNNETLTISPKGSSTTWLYCTNSNDGVRVGTNENKTFTIEISKQDNVDYNYLKNTGTSRYLGVYTNNPDWRCYTTATSNNAKQTLKFYKYVECGSTQPTYYLLRK